MQHVLFWILLDSSSAFSCTMVWTSMLLGNSIAIWQETQLLIQHRSTCCLVFDFYNHGYTDTAVLHGTTAVVFRHDCFQPFLTATVFSPAGQWSVTGTLLVVRNSTTLPWTLVVSVQHLTLLRGSDPRLPTRSPSRARAAPHTCGVRTQTRTWHQSPCSDGQERSVLRCDAGRCLIYIREKHQ